MKMKRLILGLALAGLIALAIPSSAPAANTYHAFVGCDETAEPPQPSHECLTTDHMAAYFEATEATKYEVCLYRNETIDPLDCTSEEEADANTGYRNSLEIETPGDYEVVWFDLELEPEEEEIEVWKLRISSPPPPPPPAPPVAAPIVLPALPSVNTACLRAQKRVKALKARVKKAHGHKKARLRAKLKKARAAARAAC